MLPGIRGRIRRRDQTDIQKEVPAAQALGDLHRPQPCWYHPLTAGNQLAYLDVRHVPPRRRQYPSSTRASVALSDASMRPR